MQASDFIEPFPGILTPLGGALLAFVPDPLPEALEVSPRLLIQASQAEKAIGRLSGLLDGGGNPLNPHLVGRPLQQREAIESSRIEGTFTTAEQLVLFDSDDDEPETETRGDTREVANYMVALEWALAELHSLPISSRLIRGIHERLLEGVLGKDEQPGELGNLQNFIGSSQDPLAARFVPPPPDRVPALIGALERYIHTPPEQRALVRLMRMGQGATPLAVRDHELEPFDAPH